MLTALLLVLAVVILMDAVKLRLRAGALHRIEDDDPGESNATPTAIQWFVAPGVHVDESTRRAVARVMGHLRLDALDLVPGDLAPSAALRLLLAVDPGRYRLQRLAAGITAGHAMAVTESLLARLPAPPEPPTTPLAFAELAVQLKRHACTGTDLRLARTVHALTEDPRWRRPLLFALWGDVGTLLFAGELFLLLFPTIALVGGLFGLGSVLGGLAVLSAFHVQPLLALAGTRLQSLALPFYAGLRTVLDLRQWALAWLRPRPLPPRLGIAPIDALRPSYTAAFQGGTERYFEPRREVCWMCGGTHVGPHVRLSDHFQRKPGEFIVDRCETCGHLFQNPRLNEAGLELYYRDFYDGLGEETMERIFGAGEAPYAARARLGASIEEPRRWLDVGGGHGHFACVAREVLPATEFDGLDFGEAILTARRRGWIAEAYQGQFTQLAPQLVGRYDVVSMSHYLEHTRDPRKELDAAATVLPSGGYLVIEVPNPECPYARWLGRLWLPWFQPQHQHLLSAANLERLTGEAGFESVRFEFGDAHLPVDLGFAAYIVASRIAGPAEVPWRPRRGLVRRAWSKLVWSFAAVPVLLAFGADALLAPLLRQGRNSNAFRLLARRR